MTVFDTTSFKIYVNGEIALITEGPVTIEDTKRAAREAGFSRYTVRPIEGDEIGDELPVTGFPFCGNVAIVKYNEGN